MYISWYIAISALFCDISHFILSWDTLLLYMLQASQSLYCYMCCTCVHWGRIRTWIEVLELSFILTSSASIFSNTGKLQPMFSASTSKCRYFISSAIRARSQYSTLNSTVITTFHQLSCLWSDLWSFFFCWSSFLHIYTHVCVIQVWKDWTRSNPVGKLLLCRLLYPYIPFV